MARVFRFDDVEEKLEQSNLPDLFNEHKFGEMVTEPDAYFTTDEREKEHNDAIF